MQRIEKGDTVRLIGGSPKYLNGLLAVVIEVLPVNYRVQLVQPELGRRFGDGPFATPPSLVELHKKGDGTIPATVQKTVVPQEDSPGTGLTIRDLQVGDPVRLLHEVRPIYLAGLTGVVKRIRRTKVSVTFDRPPIGTRFERGVVIRPSRLEKVKVA